MSSDQLSPSGGPLAQLSLSGSRFTRWVRRTAGATPLRSSLSVSWFAVGAVALVMLSRWKNTCTSSGDTFWSCLARNGCGVGGTRRRNGSGPSESYNGRQGTISLSATSGSPCRSLSVAVLRIALSRAGPSRRSSDLRRSKPASDRPTAGWLTVLLSSLPRS